MRFLLPSAALMAFAGASNLLAQAPALNGAPYIHDPSTIAISDGKYFTFGTGGGGLISDDGWTWNGGAQRPGGGAAPDVLKIGDRYLVAYGSTGGGLGGGHNGTIHTMWTKSLDPKSPAFGFVDDTVVASTDGFEDCDAIDPSLLLGPDNRLWLSYGTYFGFIRVVELDPKTGKRKPGNQPKNVAIDMEASSLQYRDGWYYLLGTHGTCCDGANSTYNIRVGRSKSPTGPFVDHIGTDLLRGGGKLVVAASGRFVGPGHFGRLVITEGVEKFSCHYEADLDRSGRSVLDIRPLLWRDGWPCAGDNVWEGTYQIQSERSGGALELGVDFVRMERTGGFFRHDAPQTPPTPVKAQELSQVEGGWPAGPINVRIGDFMARPHQKWTISPVTSAGGYPGSPYFKIVLFGTSRALTATVDQEVVAAPEFTGAPEQLWRVDQLTDGTYRIMPKQVPGTSEPLVLTAAAASTPTLSKLDLSNARSKWNLRKP
jgi:arabinan endo-1,5-alpha-L-arabinosidase